ncbi:MAG: hypothetical protein R3F29_04690 [Planctomycetota bacterium]
MNEGEAAAERFLEPAPALRRGLVVPDPADFEALVASQGTSEGLRDLRQAVAAWQAVAEKCDHAFEEVLKLSTYRLQVERALGARLAQDVKHGGLRSRSPEVTLVGGLPDGVSKQQAAKYRQLAAVSDDAFAAYLHISRERRRLPTSAGARRFGAPARELRVRRSARGPRPSLLREVDTAIVDFVDRLMTPDVVVGPPVMKGAVQFDVADSDALEKVRGDVFVSLAPDPTRWLPSLVEKHDEGHVRQALVVVDVDIWAAWFQQSLLRGWAFCLVSRNPVLGIALAHVGERRAAFTAAAAETGQATIGRA